MEQFFDGYHVSGVRYRLQDRSNRLLDFFEIGANQRFYSEELRPTYKKIKKIINIRRTERFGIKFTWIETFEDEAITCIKWQIRIKSFMPDALK
jgi:hypothetical protein